MRAPRVAWRLLDRAVSPVCWLLERKDMAGLGLRGTMAIARRYSKLKYRHLYRLRKDEWRRNRDRLLAENGPFAGGPVPRMTDGYYLDHSLSLPHLGRVLEDCDQIIRERGRVKRDSGRKPFIQDIWSQDLLGRFPSLLDFATSSEVVSAVADHCGFVPHLSGHLPPGIRILESDARFDPHAGGPFRESQLFHLDYHSVPTIYVIVLLKDVTPRSGPFCFLSASASRRAAEALNYRARGVDYRISDDRMFQAVPRSELHTTEYPKGTVLFIDSGACFHYGSRDPWDARYQLMIAYTSPYRTDFSEVLRPERTFPVAEGSSRLRRMVLDARWSG